MGRPKGKADSESEEPLDPRIVAAITKAVKDEMGSVNSTLKEINTTLDSLNKLHKRMDDAEKAMQHTSERLDDLSNVHLPAMVDHIARVSEALAQHTLKIDVHRRKWNLIIHGIDGPAAEEEVATRAKSVKFAKEVLRVANAEKTHFSACHRLSRKENAGIIVRFCDLSDRDAWLAGTRHIRGYAKRVSISPDIPPELRPMKDDLMRQRSQLEPDTKAKAKLRYLPSWPFVELRIDGQSPVKPKETLTTITRNILGLGHIMKLNF